MRNLIQLFIRNGGALVFIGLEILCFLMIIQFNDVHNKIFFSSLNNFGGWIDAKTAKTQDYLHLQRIVDDLTAENAKLYEKLEFQEERQKLDTVPTFSTADSVYQFIPARVIKNSINRPNNYLRLDVGRADGVEPNMGVISQFGVVGIVIDVSENYALVMSLLHQQSRISAGLSEKGYFGSLIWPGGSPQYTQLMDIPKHANVAKGDLIETSGYSLIFPPHLPLGRIESFSKADGSSTYEIEVKLLLDMAKVNYVYVVKIPDRDEQKTLELQMIHE
ncbi:MAG: rod shape-determining protein MreC [Saprospiraceae bacterium]|nr:rod shape-determining protein MreC [Saprospiraceae bacterium]